MTPKDCWVSAWEPFSKGCWGCLPRDSTLHAASRGAAGNGFQKHRQWEACRGRLWLFPVFSIRAGKRGGFPFTNPERGLAVACDREPRKTWPSILCLYTRETAFAACQAEIHFPSRSPPAHHGESPSTSFRLQPEVLTARESAYVNEN